MSNCTDRVIDALQRLEMYFDPQMRVFWGTSDPNLKKIDNGAFAKWLESQEHHASSSAATTCVASRAGHDQTAVVGYGFTPLPGTLADQVSPSPELHLALT